MSKVKGSCLCGKVHYTATLKTGVGACHCGMCRKWAGGPLMSVHADGVVDFDGQENVQTFASSEWAERGFCNCCGSNLFYRILPSEHFPQGEYILTAGSIDSTHELVFDHEVFVDHKPAWYDFNGNKQRHRMTEADILAAFGG